MEKHYQIVNEHIVFNVQDEDVVVNEIKELLDKAFENPYPYGEDSPKFIVGLRKDLAEPEKAELSETCTALSIHELDFDLIINYTAKNPVLVNIDGKFYHYWDFALSEHTVTELYADEDIESEVVGILEDDIIEILTGASD
ncbi:MAG: hypothetical protein MJZ17_08555 [Bacteroidales bacterium]|nr:hypothetical protein [Bacteroidales bacterium]